MNRQLSWIELRQIQKYAEAAQGLQSPERSQAVETLKRLTVAIEDQYGAIAIQDELKQLLAILS